MLRPWCGGMSCPRLPGDYIGRGAHHVLIQHCRHVCRSRLLERQLRTFEVEWVNVDGGLERFERLLAMADRETKASHRHGPGSETVPATADASARGRACDQ